MKIIVQELSLLLREHLDIPVYETNLPENITPSFVVVKQDLSSKNKQEEYHINIYVRNKVRKFGILSDNTYPDFEKIDSLGEDILTIYHEFIEPYRQSKLHIRKYIKEEDLHYLNLCIVFC